MDKSNTVNINGRRYDPVSGLPLGDSGNNSSAQKPASTKSAQQSPTRSVHAINVHAQTQKSQTLRRSSLKKPVPQTQSQTKTNINAIQPNKKPASTHQPVTTNPQVAKFVPHAAQNNSRMMDIGPAKHHHVVKAQAHLDAKHAPAVVKPSRVIKQEAIRTAIANTMKDNKAPKRGFRHPGVASIITASLALVILGGYMTYINMPSLSVRVAAAAAGINASYPDYRPDGYRLNGPVAYDEGQVSMQFVANAGPQHFTIKQAKSSWDSAAVLDNYVTPKAGSDYATYSEHGLTIYTFDDGVAWVNGGILYTIEGDAPLSSEQIRHIATSFI